MDRNPPVIDRTFLPFLWRFSHRPFGRAESEAVAAALPIVRLILGITLLLLGVGMLSCSVEGTLGASSTGSRAQWVRTVSGWERTDMWVDVPRYLPQPHPIVVAAGQGLLSVLALVAFQSDDELD